MEYKKEIASRFFTKQDIGGAESINDLRDKEFSGKKLTAEEKYALANFDNYNEGIVEVLSGKHSADGEGVMFFKPELTSIPYEKLRFLLAHFESLTKKYKINIQRTFIISGPFIIENNIYAENYKVFVFPLAVCLHFVQQSHVLKTNVPCVW